MIKLRRRTPEERLAKAEAQMSVVEHLEELRSRLVWSMLAVGVGLAVAFTVYDQLLEVLIAPYCDVVVPLLEERSSTPLDAECSLVFTEPTEGFATRLRVSAIAGVALAMPVLVYHLWRFITPALDRREKLWAIPFVASAAALFATGAALAYWTLPRAFEFLLQIAGDEVEPLLAVGPYLSFIAMMMLVFGIGFEFPILLIFLQLAGIVEPRSLGRYRRHAVVLIVALVAVLTPSGDPISLLALSVPMYLFYEVSALIGWFLLRRRARRQ